MTGPVAPPAPPRDSPLRLAAIALSVGVLCVASILLTRSTGRVALFWAANAFVLRLVMAQPPRAAAVRLLAAFLGNLAGDLATGDTWGLALGLSAANTFEVVLALVIARAILGPRPFDITNLRSQLALAVFSLVAPLASAPMAATLVGDDMQFRWWTADALGYLVFTPALSVVTAAGLRVLRRRAVEAALEFSAIAVAVVLSVLWMPEHRLLPVLPFVALAAFRLGAEGGALTAVAASVGGLAGIALHPGPLVANAQHMVPLLQLGLLVNVSLSLPLGLLVTRTEARARADAATLRAEKLRYDALVDRIPVGVYRVRLSPAGDPHFEFVSPQLERMLHLPPGSMVRDSAAASALLHPDDRPLFIQANRRAAASPGPFVWEGRLVIEGEIRWFRMESEPHATESGIVWHGVQSDITARMQAQRAQESAQAALRLFTRDFETLLDQTTDFIYFKDRDARFRFASQTMADITRHQSWRDLVGKHDRDIFPPDIAAMYVDGERPIFEHGRPVIGMLEQYVDAAGQPGWVETNKWPLFDADGRVDGLFGISRVVTERERAKAERAQYQSLLESTLEASADGILVIGLDRRVVWHNSRFRALWGIPAGEVLADHDRILELVGPLVADPQGFLSRLTFLCAHPDAEGTDQIDLRDGRVFERLSRPQRLGQRVVGRVCSFRDVTDRRRAAAALERESERYRSLLAIAHDGIHVIDAAGRLVEANAAFLRSIGRTPEEVPQLKVDDWDARIPGGDIRSTIAALMEAPATFETRHRRSDGTTFDAEVNAGGVTLDGQRYLLAASRDISHRKESERRLRELMAQLEARVTEGVERAVASERAMIYQSRLAAMGEMVGNIAHQWRQPLNTLGMVMANLRDAYDDGRLSDEGLHDAVAQCGRLIRQMSDTISDFTEFFRPDKEPVTFPVRAQVAEAVDLVAASFRHHGIAVTIEGDEGLASTGFPNEYSQVVLNLLSNARDAVAGRAPGDRRVAIRIACDGASCRVTVTDNGGGVTLDPIERVFEPYVTTKVGGTGLGLYMSKMIVERSLGGQLTVANVAGGAAFTLITPAGGR